MVEDSATLTELIDIEDGLDDEPVFLEVVLVSATEVSELTVPLKSPEDVEGKPVTPEE